MLAERAVCFREIAKAFVKTNLPGQTIKPFSADGSCIIHVFRKNLLSVGCKVTFDYRITLLTKWASIREIPNVYDRWCQYSQSAWTIPGGSSFSVQQSNHWSLSSSSWHGLQSNHQDLTKWLYFDQENTSNLFEDTLYFFRSESLHSDPVVPSNFVEDRNINTDSDSDASIVIIDEVNADAAVEIRDIKAEIPSTSMERDFLMHRSDNGNEQNAEEIPLHYQHMGYSIDANEQ